MSTARQLATRRLQLISVFLQIASLLALKYPNEIVEPPIVACEEARMLIKVKTTAANPSRIYAEDYIEDPECVSRNMNRLGVVLGKCGMSMQKTSNPSGIIYRLCIAVQIHPLFATDNDRSYCAQCVYMQSTVVEDFEQSLSISDAVASELDVQFDMPEGRPKCAYEIRRASLDGPLIHYATIGETVFHVWKCSADNIGILVQNCYVEDGQGNRILIIDQNGCGVDQYILPTPQYTSDLRVASQETRVFKFAEKTITRFSCQIRLCLMEKGMCDAVTPPRKCPSLEERLAQQKSMREDGKVVMESGLPGELRKQVSDAAPTVALSATGGNGSRAFAPAARAVIRRRSRRDAPTLYRNMTAPQAPFLLTHQPQRTRRGSMSEMNVVGVLMVLDSPDDVDFFEQKLPASAFDPKVKCVSRTAFFAITTALATFCAVNAAVLISCFSTRFMKSTSLKQSFKYGA